MASPKYFFSAGKSGLLIPYRYHGCNPQVLAWSSMCIYSYSWPAQIYNMNINLIEHSGKLPAKRELRGLVMAFAENIPEQQWPFRAPLRSGCLLITNKISLNLWSIENNNFNWNITHLLSLHPLVLCWTSQFNNPCSAHHILMRTGQWDFRPLVCELLPLSLDPSRLQTQSLGQFGWEAFPQNSIYWIVGAPPNVIM